MPESRANPRRNAPIDAEKVRQDFPIFQREINGHPLVYLDNAATSQKPRQVIAAISNYYSETNSNVHRGVHTLSIEATDAYERSRATVAAFVNSPSPDCVIWTRNTTESLNLVSYGWGDANVEEGDNIVTTAMEHHSDIVPWQQLAIRKDAELRIAPITDEGILDVQRTERLIDTRTKIVALTHMSNVLGCVNPVKHLTDVAHSYGAVLVVDGAQSVPHFPVDVQRLDCDFLAFSAHKMLGPTGVGVLYGKRDLLNAMNPTLFGGDMISEVSYEGAVWNDLPYKFEAGTPNIAGAIGMAAGVEYLSALGMDNVWAHEQELTEYALDRFTELKNVRVIGPQEVKNRGGVISFFHSKMHPHDLGTALDSVGIAIRTGHHCAMPLVRSFGEVAAARASFYIYNTKADVDAFIAGMRKAEDYF